MVGLVCERKIIYLSLIETGYGGIEMKKPWQEYEQLVLDECKRVYDDAHIRSNV